MVPKQVRPGASRDEDLYFLRPAAQLAGYEFTPEEWSLVARLRQPTSFTDLQRASGFAPERIERLLKLLRIADALVIFPAVISGSPSDRVVVRPRAESSDLERPSSDPPSSDTRELAHQSHTRRSDLEARAKAVESDRIPRAGSDRAQHPRDTLRDDPRQTGSGRAGDTPRHDPRRPARQQIWGGGDDAAAHGVGDAPSAARPSPRPAPAARSLPPPRRSPRPERPSSAPAAPRKSLPPRAPARPPTEKEAEAASTHFDAARYLAKDHRWREALAHAERAVRLDGLRAEYAALYGWLLHLSGPSTDQTDHAIDAHLVRALKLDPDCAIAHYYRGMMRKRWGDDHGAEAHLRRAHALDPKLVDAAREVRLYDARRERRTPRETDTESGPLRRFVASLRKKG